MLEIRLSELKQHLLECNYPEKVIDKGISKAKMVPREELRKPKAPADPNIEKIPFITTFNPNVETKNHIVRHVMKYLKTSEKTKEVFRKTEIINARRQPNNLKRMLTSAQFKKKSTFQVKKCGDLRCLLCRHNLEEGTSFTFSNGETLSVNADMSCKVINCIYVMRCLSCKKQYIGETSDFRKRVNLHRNQVKHKCGLDVDQHIHECTKDIEGDFKIMPFFKMPDDNTARRRTKEKFFIDTLKPELNRYYPYFT